MEQGWIKFHRKLLDNVFLMHDNSAYIVFTKLLLLVNRRTGQYATGRNALGETVNMKPITVYKVLIRLEEQHLINISSNNRYSIISICNWGKYQEDGNTSSNIPVTSQEHQSNNAVTLNKKEERRKKNNKGFDFFEFQELEPELKSFIEMRKALRKPATPTALKLIVDKLRKLYPDDIAKQKLCLNQSIERSWAGVFALKESDTPKSQKSWF